MKCPRLKGRGERRRLHVFVREKVKKYFLGKYVNKSWIVVPKEKRDLIENRYMEYLREHQIGAILVEEEGHWEVLYRAYYHTEIKFHQQVLKLAMKEY